MEHFEQYARAVFAGSPDLRITAGDLIAEGDKALAVGVLFLTASERIGFASLDALFAFLQQQTNDETIAVEREDQAEDEAPMEPDA